jgi:hypothetical protein
METYWITIKYKPSSNSEEQFSQHMGMRSLAEKNNSLGNCWDGREKDTFNFARKKCLDGFLKDIEGLEFVNSIKTKIILSEI